ncbi:hypothetical protein HY406_01630 [Candidatus Giovannonibacteria bacterium]|nr:hypothetical protein [Candidatus Giovannonibacteria bacterium]
MPKAHRAKGAAGRTKMGNSKEGTVWSVDAGKLASATTKLWGELGGSGARVIEQLDRDQRFRRRLAEFALRGGVESSVHQKIVRAVMGKNFWGIEDWAADHGVRLPRKQEGQVAEFPWGEDILNSTCPLCGKVVKDCHFAYLGLAAVNGKSLTILELQKLYPYVSAVTMTQSKFSSYAPGSWYTTHDFAKATTLSFRWYLLHKEIVPNSTSMDFGAQQKMLPPEYEVPLCVEEVAKDLLVWKKTGVPPNSSVYARCRDVSAGGFRLYAGGCGCGGVGIDGWGDSGYSDIGVAASRKIPS